MDKIKIISSRKNWLKPVCGGSVVIGRTYGGVTAVDTGETERGQWRALSFAGGALLLGSPEQTDFLFTAGDLAAFGGRIFTDRVSCHIRFPEAVTEKTDFGALRDRYYRVPRSLLDAIQKAVRGG